MPVVEHAPVAGQRVAVLVTVIVPVTAAVLAGVAAIAGVPAGTHAPPPVPQLAGATRVVDSESCPVSARVVLTPPAVITRFAFLAACDELVGLKTTVSTQLCPAPSVTPAPSGPVQ